MAKILNKIKLYHFNKNDRLIVYKELAISEITDHLVLQLADQKLFIKINNKVLLPEETAKFLLENLKLKKSIIKYLSYYFPEKEKNEKK